MTILKTAARKTTVWVNVIINKIIINNNLCSTLTAVKISQKTVQSSVSKGKQDRFIKL